LFFVVSSYIECDICKNTSTNFERLIVLKPKMRNCGKRRVAITGLGILSSVGIGKQEFWESVKNGQSGIRPITLFNAETFPVRIAGEIRNFDPQLFFPKEFTRRLDRFALLGLAATKLALEDASLPMRFSNQDGERVCVRIGTVIGALAHAEATHSLFLEKGAKRIHPYFSSLVLPSSLASQIGILCGIHGSVATTITACASGTSAIGEAFRLVRAGDFDVAIAGASETPITPLIMASFSSLGLLASNHTDPSKACRPFSIDRSGIVLAEGAAVVILEELGRARERGGKIYGEVLGYGESFDGYHTHHPLPSAEYCAKAIRDALDDAAVRPDEVDYVNPHGSASLLNDKTETMAIKKAFGEHAYRLSASSTKSMIGHALGACGALEFVACALMLEHQFIHPTINMLERDPECDLDFVPNVGRSLTSKNILTISSGFGGYNAACVLGKHYCQ
jgi:3-oxoacyl-[acyl-carrier-protein] synthase II